ncbi:MAG: hypothetical protein ABH824_02720 [Nanoarchaeota archaeon]
MIEDILITDVTRKGARVHLNERKEVGSNISLEIGSAQIRWRIGEEYNEEGFLVKEQIEDGQVVQKNVGYKTLKERFGEDAGKFKYVIGVQLYEPKRL